MEALALARLLSSRICHDLISPVGAIGNGMELLRASGGDGGREELELISDCADSASAALRLMRLAFGARPADDTLSTDELEKAIDAHYARRRVDLDWSAAPKALPAAAAQPLLWLAMTAIGAAPRGGRATLAKCGVAPLDLAWRLEGDGGSSETSRALFVTRPNFAEAAPGDAHIILLWVVAEAMGAAPYWTDDGLIGVG